jgi:signal transduction histidine kinase
MGDRRDPADTRTSLDAPRPARRRDDRPDALHGLAGVVVHDSDGRIVSVTPRATRLMGVNLDKAGVARPPVWSFTNADGDPVEPTELPPFIVAAVGHPVAGGLVGVDDGSGRRRWLRVDCEEVRDQLGRVELMVTTVHDATSERQAQVIHQATRDVSARAATGMPTDPLGLIHDVLPILGEACDGTRVLAVGIDRSRGRVMLIDQWSAAGEPWPSDDRGAPIDLFAGLLPRLARGKPLRIDDLSVALGSDLVRDRLQLWGIRSGVVAPLTIAGRLEGFVVLTWNRVVSAPRATVDLVMMVAEVLAAATVVRRSADEVTELRELVAGHPADASSDAIGLRRAELYVDVTPDLLLEIDQNDILTSIVMPAGYESTVLSSLQGVKVLEVFHGAERARLAEVLRAVRSGSPIEVFEFEWLDGDLLRGFEARFTASPTGMIVSVIREVTGAAGRDRAVYEQSHVLAMANEELTRLVHERDQFLASVSHELRTPLNAILGLTEVLLDRDDPLTTSQRSTLRTIDSSGRHLLELINDLLDLSRLRARVVALDLRDVPIADPCQWTLDLIRPRAVARGVRVEMVNPTGDLRVRADERRLRQVLINLMDNAVNFTEPGGTAGLQVWQPDAEHVALSVWDTGSGIAPGDQSRIFEPFAQLGGRRGESRRAGSGLGLSVVERLVSLHEGHIEVDSVPGQGSRFTVVLPLAGPDGDTQEMAVLPDPPSADR